jgi:hypothetical protein
MTIDLFPKYKQGEKVRLKPQVVSIHAQYLPKNLVGTIKASYMMPNGVRLREELDVVFSLPDPANSMGQPIDVEMRAISAEQVERA